MRYYDIMMQIIAICTRLKLTTIGVFKCCVNVVANVEHLVPWSPMIWISIILSDTQLKHGLPSFSHTP